MYVYYVYISDHVYTYIIYVCIHVIYIHILYTYKHDHIIYM